MMRGFGIRKRAGCTNHLNWESLGTWSFEFWGVLTVMALRLISSVSQKYNSLPRPATAWASSTSSLGDRDRVYQPARVVAAEVEVNDRERVGRVAPHERLDLGRVARGVDVLVVVELHLLPLEQQLVPRLLLGSRQSGAWRG